MKTIKLGLVVASAICLLATQSVAQNATGTWKGKLNLDTSSVPKAKDAQQKKMIEASLAMVSKMTFNLTLSSNKTWKISVSGLPQGPDGKVPGQTDTGKWSQSGNKITLTSSRKDSKSKPQVLTISKDGKTMTLVMPKEANQGKSSIVFKKG